jgi:autotransporter translocation and assembly factor TamB
LGDFFEWPKDYTVKGGLSLTAQLAGHGLQLDKIETTGKLSALYFTETSGQQAAQDLASDFTLTLRPGAERWQFQARLAPHRGQLYVAPMLVEFSGDEVKLDANGEWSKERITLSRLILDHPSVAQAEAQVALSRNPLRLQAATIKLNTPRAGQFYQRYLQATLSGTAFEALQGDGALAATLQYSGQGLEFIKTDLKNLSIKDEQGRYELHSLNGSLAWTRGNTPLLSDFQWQGGSIYKLTLGAARVRAESVNAGFSLPEGVEIPLLDGVLKMDSAKLENLGRPDQRIELAGALTPVSMPAFTRAMEWPDMNGKLSGIIPALSYSQGKLEVGGALLMKVFDGDVVVRNLSLADPLGTTPVLIADVDMDNLDLDMLTQTFSFGRIQGRLNGTVHDLRMENWNPVAFDARFATPDGDTSRHRISQKAVDSLSSLGGAGGVLSRSFLRFFDEFSYDRLGLTCRLQRGVCEMDGVEQATKGYYIVKGGGIPRIDVIGYAKEVDWDVFLERLKQATRSEGPVVQ